MDEGGGCQGWKRGGLGGGGESEECGGMTMTKKR